MSHIFISYSHKDKDCVHKLQEALQNESFEVWIDDRIDFGTTWPKVIQKHLDDCAAFMVVMTEDADESIWVQNEVTRAQRKQKPFFALLLKGEPWLSVEAIQYEDVTGERLPSKKFYSGLALVIAREEKAARDQAEQDATERVRNERIELEAVAIAENIARVNAQQAAAEKLAREKQEQENAKRIAREKAERELKELESRAIRFELLGKLSDALKVYYQIKRLDPLFPQIDIKINQLEKETRLESPLHVPRAKPVQSKNPTTALPLLTGILVGISLLIVLSSYAVNSIFPHPHILTLTPTKL